MSRSLRRVITLNRRRLLIGAGAAFTLHPLRTHAAITPNRLSIIYPNGTIDEIRRTSLVAGFLSELDRLGFREGAGISVSIQSAYGNTDLGLELVKKTAAEAPDLIFVYTGAITLNLLAATQSIPIIACVNNPIEMGVASGSTATPTNLTGVDVDGGTTLYANRLNILREAGLKFIRPAFVTPNLNDLRGRVNELRPIWKDLVAVQVEEPIDEVRLRRAFRIMIEEGADAIVVSNSPVLAAFREVVTSLAREFRIPAVYPYSSYVEVGGLLSYGPNFNELGRHAAQQADQIFRGTIPNYIPFYRPPKYELAVNQKTARAMNVTLAAAVVNRADAVVE